MDVVAWDSVFVRARRADVHPVLRDPGSYATWWPGARATVTAPGSTRLELRPPTRQARLRRTRHVLDVRVVKDRRDLGLDVALGGTLTGPAEWYYLDEVAGTVVHWVAKVSVADRGGRRVLAEHRASVRAALQVLKAGLEGGRPPGEEPSAALVADQVQAAEAFRRGVEAWQRRQAARRDG